VAKTLAGPRRPGTRLLQHEAWIEQPHGGVEGTMLDDLLFQMAHDSTQLGSLPRKAFMTCGSAIETLHPGSRFRMVTGRPYLSEQDRDGSSYMISRIWALPSLTALAPSERYCQQRGGGTRSLRTGHGSWCCRLADGCPDASWCWWAAAALRPWNYWSH